MEHTPFSGDITTENYRVLIAKVLGNKLLQYSQFTGKPFLIREFTGREYSLWTSCFDPEILCEHIHKKIENLELKCDRLWLWYRLQELWFCEKSQIMIELEFVLEKMKIGDLKDLDINF